MAEESEHKVKAELELRKDNVTVEPVVGNSEKIKKQVYEVIEAEKQKKKASQKQKHVEIASYKPNEIAKSPLKSPEPDSKALSNKHQRAVMIMGFVLILMGLVLWPVVTFAAGLCVAFAGAAVIAFGTLIPV
jgi:Fe2+ transport system protein B